MTLKKTSRGAENGGPSGSTAGEVTNDEVVFHLSQLEEVAVTLESEF